MPGICLFVCLPVCLNVSNCTQKLNELLWKFYHKCICGQGRIDYISEVIRFQIRIQEFFKDPSTLRNRAFSTI